MTKKVKICHLTSVHPRYDTRIFVKECGSLADQGYDVHLVVADGIGDEIKNGIKIHDIGKQTGRIGRILFAPKKVYKMALSIRADIYHFHDPELLRIGKKLVRKGFKVVYDVHEDVPRQILNKAYIPSVFRKKLSSIVEQYENSSASKFSGIVTATPFIKDRFMRLNANVITAQNFPILAEFNSNEHSEKENAVCYIGSISKVRGILNMVGAMHKSRGTKLLLGGRFETMELRESALTTKGWDNVVELGFLNRDEVSSTLAKSIAGLVVLEPTISYLDSIPVKMFEYMAAGIPIIASDFSYWRTLLSGVNCALFVDPLNQGEISLAIKKLAENKEMASEMGKVGRKAIEEVFNWNREKEKLNNLYAILLHE